MKKIFIGIGITLAIFFIIVISIIVSLVTAGNAVVNEEIKQQEKIESDVSKLEVKDIKKVGDKLEGTITNTLEYPIDYLEINFKFFDKDGIKIEDNMTNTTNFSIGETWKFEIFLFEEEFQTYEYELNMSVY